MAKIMGLFEITGTYHKLSVRAQELISDRAKRLLKQNKNKKGDK